MTEEIRKFLASSDLNEVEKGIELATQMNINIEIDLYEQLYRWVYRNHTRIKKADTIPIAEKIRSLNLRESLTIHLDDFDISFEAMSKLNNLKKVKIFFSRFGVQFSYSFSKSIFELASIKELIMVHYPLDYLHESLNKLEKLEVLDLGNNKIEHFPSEISNLKKLRKLIVKNNPISNKEINRIQSILPHCEIEK